MNRFSETVELSDDFSRRTADLFRRARDYIAEQYPGYFARFLRFGERMEDGTVTGLRYFMELFAPAYSADGPIGAVPDLVARSDITEYVRTRNLGEIGMDAMHEIGRDFSD